MKRISTILIFSFFLSLQANGQKLGILMNYETASYGDVFQDFPYFLKFFRPAARIHLYGGSLSGGLNLNKHHSLELQLSFSTGQTELNNFSISTVDNPEGGITIDRIFHSYAGAGMMYSYKFWRNIYQNRHNLGLTASFQYAYLFKKDYEAYERYQGNEEPHRFDSFPLNLHKHRFSLNVGALYIYKFSRHFQGELRIAYPLRYNMMLIDSPVREYLLNLKAGLGFSWIIE